MQTVLRIGPTPRIVAWVDVYMLSSLVKAISPTFFSISSISQPIHLPFSRISLCFSRPLLPYMPPYLQLFLPLAPCISASSPLRSYLYFSLITHFKTPPLHVFSLLLTAFLLFLCARRGIVARHGTTSSLSPPHPSVPVPVPVPVLILVLILFLFLRLLLPLPLPLHLRFPRSFRPHPISPLSLQLHAYARSLALFLLSHLNCTRTRALSLPPSLPFPPFLQLDMIHSHKQCTRAQIDQRHRPLHRFLSHTITHNTPCAGRPAAPPQPLR
jgi:hypothetical protein